MLAIWRAYARVCPARTTARSHRKKRVGQVKKLMQRGLLDPEKEDPFSLFVASTNIRYCYYHETQNILGNTFGMCVLQVRAFQLFR
jgi:tRNA(Met) C34 N-acetyltransferase TmcA